MSRINRIFFSLIAIIYMCSSAVAESTVDDVVSALMLLCVNQSTMEELSASGKGEVVLTLRRLLDVGADANVASTFTRKEWIGINGGISSSMTSIQAEQADKVRDCLKPYTKGIVDAMLKAD